jgi:hypothetical protein
MPDHTVEGIARSYIEAVGSHSLAALEDLLAEDLAAHLSGRERCDARVRWQELHPA